MEQHTRLQYLLERLVAYTATAEELTELTTLVEQDNGTTMEEVAQLLASETTASYQHDHWMSVADRILAADKLPADPATAPVHRLPFLHRWGWAAAVVVLLGTAAYLLQHYQRTQPPALVTAPHQPDVAPGSNGAILTLADGSHVVLDSAGKGVITTQGNTRVMLKDNGLQYTPGGGANSTVAYNTITTPKGKQFHVVLPDGTQVWLNAGSVLQFPVAFSGKERQVDLSGEAFFEVAAKATQPFKVLVRKQLEVAVLGTGFNVSAYTNEQSIATTLITGSVRVSLPHATQSFPVILKPGQQARWEDQQLTVAADANVEQAIAWKNGLFNFEGVGLREMMRQLERWYNLEVVYEGNVPDVRFFGEMSRSLKLSDVLSGLESAEVHFRLEEGRRLVVMP
ncbi:MAG: FecR domain-containing protein [Chitinophaga sp.]|uniref:FecR family protein n=1 Tax=Chitinophaga sp. TaxID=1869181 RepID=UPI001B16F293|nr:FecR family protein [Chitinophaga sp.]MBO9729562.1 FecR domain-containing protein [Chitinophaga sp.]